MIIIQALFTLQITDTILYTVTAVVIYRFTGENVMSPALGSTSRVLSKVAYGIALPTIVIAGVINGHIAVVCILLTKLYLDETLIFLETHLRSLR